MEIFDRRIDWLIAAIPVGIAIHLFYGLNAAIVSIVLIAGIVFLKPLRMFLETPRSRIAFAAGLVLLCSPLFRIVFTDGFCFGAHYSPFGGMEDVGIDSLSEGVILGELVRQAGEHCQENLWDMLESNGGTGYIRDIGFTVIGAILLILGLIWREQKVSM